MWLKRTGAEWSLPGPLARDLALVTCSSHRPGGVFFRVAHRKQPVAFAQREPSGGRASPCTARGLKGRPTKCKVRPCFLRAMCDSSHNLSTFTLTGSSSSHGNRTYSGQALVFNSFLSFFSIVSLPLFTISRPASHSITRFYLYHSQSS